MNTGFPVTGSRERLCSWRMAAFAVFMALLQTPAYAEANPPADSTGRESTTALPGRNRQEPPASGLPGRDWLWEPLLPGYTLYRQHRPLGAALIAGGRVLSIAGMFYFHQQSVRYASAETAARNADLYYGAGLRYRDPYSSSYRSSADFRNMADRNLNLSYYAAGLQLLLLAVGIFNGVQNEDLYRLQHAPIIEVQASAFPARLRDASSGQDLFCLAIPQDF